MCVCVGVYITNVMRMGVCVARTYLCVRAFTVETGERIVKSYLHIYVCVSVYVRVRTER